MRERGPVYPDRAPTRDEVFVMMRVHWSDRRAAELLRHDTKMPVLMTRRG